MAIVADGVISSASLAQQQQQRKKVKEKTFSKALCISDVGVLFDRVCSPLGARSAQNSTSSFMHDMQCIALQCRIQGGSRSVGSVVILFASFFFIDFHLHARRMHESGKSCEHREFCSIFNERQIQHFHLAINDCWWSKVVKETIYVIRSTCRRIG